MDLFDLAPELVHLIFDDFVLSRDFTRAMRLRLVSSQFKNYVDDSIFRLRLLHRLGSHIRHIKLLEPTERHRQGWVAYVRSYLEYQARRERSTTSPLGRIYRAAQTLCEEGGDAGSGAITACLKSLVRLATKPRRRHVLFVESTTECSASDLKADIYIAAVCLGRKAYIQQLIAEGVPLCNRKWRRQLRSSVFGDSLRAAAYQGDLEMIKLIFSSIIEDPQPDTAPIGMLYCVLRIASTYGHRTVFDYAAEMIICTSGNIGDIGSLLVEAKRMDDLERLAAKLGVGSKRSSMENGSNVNRRLYQCVSTGEAETTQYFLSKGASPNDVQAHQKYLPGTIKAQFMPLLRAIHNSDEAITRILLDGGADPNWYLLDNTALMAAARKGNVAIAKLLLDHGAHVNEGYPPPIAMAVFTEHLDMFRLLRDHGARLDTPETGGWAMALAKMHGLDSMVDLLVREGVGEDVILHRVQSRVETTDYRNWHLWPTPAIL
ncbi:ankyrin [Hypoxylon crocopeplum]|nr:ankyrin [Hypoxylon crocopeplum]